ncbi:hypothetical protein L1887_01651 [Cichorium endivia]|nr:hypothetical protein L1887_01651 [Cichorium endivia]
MDLLWSLPSLTQRFFQDTPAPTNHRITLSMSQWLVYLTVSGCCSGIWRRRYDDDDLEANHGCNKGDEAALGSNLEHIIPNAGDNVLVYSLPPLTRHIYFNINSSSHESEHQVEPQSQGKISPSLNLWDQPPPILCTLLEAEFLSA